MPYSQHWTMANMAVDTSIHRKVTSLLDRGHVQFCDCEVGQGAKPIQVPLKDVLS